MITARDYVTKDRPQLLTKPARPVISEDEARVLKDPARDPAAYLAIPKRLGTIPQE